MAHVHAGSPLGMQGHVMVLLRIPIVSHGGASPSSVHVTCRPYGTCFPHINVFATDMPLLLSWFGRCGGVWISKIRKTAFRNSQLQESDFAEADLTGAVFDNCDLTRAIFDQTVLEKTDFRTSYNYSIDPEINRIKRAKFSILGVSGLLDKYDIEIER